MDGRADLLDGGGVGVGPLQDSRGLPVRFLGRVPEHAGKRLVGVNDLEISPGFRDFRNQHNIVGLAHNMFEDHRQFPPASAADTPLKLY